MSPGHGGGFAVTLPDADEEAGLIRMARDALMTPGQGNARRGRAGRPRPPA